MSGRVLLLHGLWMRRPALWPLAGRLQGAGFVVRSFPYATLWSRPEDSLARLARWMRDAGDAPVHLVGHSLGGVTALAMLAQQAGEGLPAGRVVCLGSPIAGSAAAAQLHARGLGLLAGRSIELLKRGVPVPVDREVGMIAGTRALGLGRWFAPLDGEHDGTVAVSETRRPHLADHLCLEASHSGLLFSAEAARQTAHFLAYGHFDRG